MKLHHQEITIKVLVPKGYHVLEVLTEQAVVPRIAEITDANFNTIADLLTTRITITKDRES